MMDPNEYLPKFFAELERLVDGHSTTTPSPPRNRVHSKCVSETAIGTEPLRLHWMKTL
jgi:hypothetical protein